MFPNFIKTSFRNIRRQKGFSIINILGLSLGLCSCLLIWLFIRDERQYDSLVPRGGDIYRVYQKTKGDESNIIATAPPAFATALQENFPEVEQTVRVLNYSSKELFEANKKKLYEENGFVADSNFFTVFPLTFRFGSASEVFNGPNSIVISSEMSERYFGRENPVGREISFETSLFLITGVLEKGQKFHLPINYIIPMNAAGLQGTMMESWQWYPFNTYVQLKKGTDPMQLQKKFQDYSRPFLKGDGGINEPFFQPLAKIHLHSSDFKYDMSVRGNISYVRALTIIAIFILLIACFNFVNLATSKSLQRAKEVGVRKTIGAGRKQLIVQFIGETIVLSFISMVLAVAATYLLLPVLNQFTGKQIHFDLLTNPAVPVSVVVVACIVGILAGFYPALVLSGFKPIHVLKGSVTHVLPGKTPWLRHSLVVIQFSLSVLLIISAIVVIDQVRYMHTKDLGFRKEQILFFPLRGETLVNNYESFKNELARFPGVSSVSIGYGFPGDIFGDGLMTVKEKPEIKPTRATQLMVDADYIKTLGLTLIAGRDFSGSIQGDRTAYIINETAVRELGLGSPSEAIGKTLSWPTWRKPDSLKTGPVIGVVQDFHYKSLHQRVEPAVLHIYPEAYSKVAIKLKGAHVASSLAAIKTLWNRFSPDYPIEYNFLDESFTKMYQAEDKLKTLLSVFTAITIFVACLGLLGLATYAAEKRRKELGIRKVLGATVQSLVILLSKEFVKLVIISLLIASPVAWYFMNQWLDNFSYRISISWWMFAVAGLTAVFLALLTVSFQSARAALSNPVDNLRTE